MLPKRIEIRPVNGWPRVAVTVPGSKSITNRALVLAALGTQETTLQGALWSEDTQVMTEALRELGFRVQVEADPVESSNRTITVWGEGGRIPRSGSADRPLELFVGNAGTAARFLSALVCLGQGRYRLHGVPRMHQRPQQALFEALRELGYQIDTPNDQLPATIQGAGPRRARARVSVKESSQFASALLLCAEAGGWLIDVRNDNAEEAPYIAMTRQLLSTFPRAGGRFLVEPDASSGSYFWAADWLLREGTGQRGALISVAGWPDSGWQIDAEFPRYLPLPESLSRVDQLGDSIMTAIVLAPLADHPIRFTGLGRLRVQECDRVKALHTELTRCGARLREEADMLEVFPSRLHGADVQTYGDHRIAMCFAVLGLKIPGIRITDPACVKKTFPGFFQKLVANSPAGLGAEIVDAESGRRLTLDQLLAK